MVISVCPPTNPVVVGGCCDWKKRCLTAPKKREMALSFYLRSVLILCCFGIIINLPSRYFPAITGERLVALLVGDGRRQVCFNKNLIAFKWRRAIHDDAEDWRCYRNDFYMTPPHAAYRGQNRVPWKFHAVISTQQIVIWRAGRWWTGLMDMILHSMQTPSVFNHICIVPVSIQWTRRDADAAAASTAKTKEQVLLFYFWYSLTWPSTEL